MIGPFVLLVYVTIGAQSPSLYYLAGGLDVTTCGQQGSAKRAEALQKYPGAIVSFQCLTMAPV